MPAVGLLAGLVLLVVPGRVSWALAGMLLAAEVVVRASVTGLPPVGPGWYGVIVAVTYYVDDALEFFGLVRLAQIVGEVERARAAAAGLAVARERLQAAGELQAAVGERLAGIAATAAAAGAAAGTRSRGRVRYRSATAARPGRNRSTGSLRRRRAWRSSRPGWRGPCWWWSC